MKNRPGQELAVDFRDVQLDDIIANPHKYGAPTLEEFAALREKYLGREDDAMIALTDGPRTFRKDLERIKFQVNGFDMKEEQVEVALGDYGYTLSDIDLENRNSLLKKQIEMVPLGGGKFELVVNFLP